MTAANLESDVKVLIDKIGSAIIRTTVPYLVGFVVTLGLHVGLHVNSEWLGSVLTVGIGSAYYALFHYLEVFVSANYGKWLGKVGAPKYLTDRVPDAADAAVVEITKHVPDAPARPTVIDTPAATPDAAAIIQPGIPANAEKTDGPV